jgi:hypothetical protein
MVAPISFFFARHRVNDGRRQRIANCPNGLIGRQHGRKRRKFNVNEKARHCHRAGVT